MDSIDFFNLSSTCGFNSCSLIILIGVILIALIIIGKLLFYILKKRTRLIKKVTKDQIAMNNNFVLAKKEKENKENKEIININTTAIANNNTMVGNSSSVKNSDEKIKIKSEKKLNYDMNAKILKPTLPHENNLEIEYLNENDNENNDDNTDSLKKYDLEKETKENDEKKERNYENYIKLKNKDKMLSSDDSVQFMSNVDLNEVSSSQSHSIKIINKFEVQKSDGRKLSESPNNSFDNFNLSNNSKSIIKLDNSSFINNAILEENEDSEDRNKKRNKKKKSAFK